MSDKKSLRLLDYLAHMAEAIERIQAYTHDVVEVGFLNSTLLQDAVLRNLEVLGEASRNIERDCPEFARQHPDLPLSIAWQMRNAIAHGYFQVDFEIVWRTIERDLPALYQQVQHLRQSL